MNIFGWGELKDTKALEQEIKKAHELVVVERQSRIEAEIELSKKDASHASELETVRSAREVEVNSLKRKLEEVQADKKDDIEAGIRETVVGLERSALEMRTATRKELRAEFGTELDTLKKENKSLTAESAKNKGNYDGALLVIKSLEKQLEETHGIVEGLIGKLPTMKADFTTPSSSVVVGSGNKS